MDSRHAWLPACVQNQAGGVNPVNNFSEFAGVPYREQCEQISKGNAILKSHGVNADIFFAPAHTYDKNTLKALKETTDIRIISDTVANDVYFQDELYFIPQQSGAVRTLPFKVVTFCYHPNLMDDNAFEILEEFLGSHADEFGSVSPAMLQMHRKSLYDAVLQMMYRMRNIRKRINHK